MKNHDKDYLYVWASDFSKSRGEGLLARNYIFNCSKYTKKKIFINGINYLNLKNKNTYTKTGLINDYLYPFIGVLKIWKEHLSNKKTIYLNYLPLWNFFIFFFLPKNTVLGPITGGSNYSKSNFFNYYIRKFLFPLFFNISLRIIKTKFENIIFSTDLLKKYTGNENKFIFNYCLNIYNKKIFKKKKKYDVIFYYRRNKNKNNFLQKKLIIKLINNNYKVSIIGDNPFLTKSFYLGNLNREKALQHISKSKYAVNNSENMYSLFCLDSLSCGTKVIHFGKRNSTKNFFNKKAIIQKNIYKVEEQFYFLKKIFKSKKKEKIRVNQNFLLNKKKIKNYFLNL